MRWPTPTDTERLDGESRARVALAHEYATHDGTRSESDFFAHLHLALRWFDDRGPLAALAEQWAQAMDARGLCWARARNPLALRPARWPAPTPLDRSKHRRALFVIESEGLLLCEPTGDLGETEALSLADGARRWCTPERVSARWPRSPWALVCDGPPSALRDAVHTRVNLRTGERAPLLEGAPCRVRHALSPGDCDPIALVLRGEDRAVAVNVTSGEALWESRAGYSIPLESQSLLLLRCRDEPTRLVRARDGVELCAFANFATVLLADEALDTALVFDRDLALWRLSTREKTRVLEPPSPSLREGIAWWNSDRSEFTHESATRTMGDEELVTTQRFRSATGERLSIEQSARDVGDHRLQSVEGVVLERNALRRADAPPRDPPLFHWREGLTELALTHGALLALGREGPAIFELRNRARS